MSSKHPKNDGSCLGYFIIIAFIYYAYDTYGTKILNFLKKSLKIIVVIVLIWFALFILYKIAETVYHYMSNKKDTNPESIHGVACDDIILDPFSDQTQSNCSTALNVGASAIEANSDQEKTYYSITSNAGMNAIEVNSNQAETDCSTAPIESEINGFSIPEGTVKYVQKKIDEAANLQDIVNTTTNRQDFFFSFDKMVEILKSLIIFEGTIDFAISPSEMLKYIMADRQKSIQALEKRIKEESAKQTNGLSKNGANPSKSYFSVDHPIGFSDDERFKYYNDKFDYMTGYDFEQYCAHLLHDVGFSDINVTSASNDFGADILAKYNGILYAFQCKRYSSNVGVHAVHEIVGGMSYYHAQVGVVITNQYYTNQAQEMASEIGIQLWDRDFLQKLIDGSINGSDLISLIFASKRSF